jgi:histidyl-tRNA synthetase
VAPLPLPSHSRARVPLPHVVNPPAGFIPHAQGTRDFMPAQMQERQWCFETIRAVFRRHGGQETDTPALELRDTLLGKYGEEGAKDMYEIADGGGGEALALRYDLTVPFARYVAMHNPGNMKRFQIARVYRRDTPSVHRVRLREFYQCDFDIAGDFPSGPMMADAEVLKVASETFTALQIGGFVIKVRASCAFAAVCEPLPPGCSWPCRRGVLVCWLQLNHRGILEAIFGVCGVDANEFAAVCATLDKLDRMSWDAVRTELIELRAVPATSADRIGTGHACM